MSGIIGAIAGDIIGSVYEFDRIKTKEFILFGDHHGEQCTFTDDTVMTLAVAQALMDADGDWAALSAHADRRMHELGARYPDRDYGERFGMWLFLDDPFPYNSFGNGAAMRVSPVAYVANSIEEALFLSDQVTKISHNHPEGMKGARAAAACGFLARTGWDRQQIRQYVRENYYPLDQTLADIRPEYAFNETCQQTVPQAIQAFLEAESFEDAIRNAVSLGGDSDTLAAITGGIAGEYFGVPDQIRRQTLDYLPDDLRQIIDRFEAAFEK